MKRTIRMLAGAALLSLPMATGAQAVGIGNSTFNANFTVGGVSTGELTSGAAQSPGTCESFGTTAGCDLLFEENFSDLYAIDWIDEDSFDLFFYVPPSGSTGDFTEVVVELYNLDFSMGGLSVPITGASFNINDSDVSSYLADPIDNPTGASFNEPTVTTTASSILIDFNGVQNQLIADGPYFRFDVETESIAPVPLPAGALLMIGGIASLGAVARKHKTS